MDNQNKKKILLIDDDASLLVTLSDFLRFEGYEVVTADSGEQGLKRLARVNPDLIILDMSMPGMGGIGFLKEVTGPTGRPKYPVLVLTARANMAEFFANVEVDGFIAKPCDPEDLLMEVGRIVFLRSSGPEQVPTQRVEVKKKILIGEDDDITKEMLKSAFSDAGYIVDCVKKGPEVLEKAIVQRPDVIVMKLVFSSMNGDAVANMLKEMPNTKNIPVVIYDDSNPPVPESRIVGIGTSVKHLVRGNNPASLVHAANEAAR